MEIAMQFVAIARLHHNKGTQTGADSDLHHVQIYVSATKLKTHLRSIWFNELDRQVHCTGHIQHRLGRFNLY